MIFYSCAAAALVSSSCKMWWHRLAVRCWLVISRTLKPRSMRLYWFTLSLLKRSMALRPWRMVMKCTNLA